MRVVDVRSMTWYGNVDEIFVDWSMALVELSNTPPFLALGAIDLALCSSPF